MLYITCIFMCCILLGIAKLSVQEKQYYYYMEFTNVDEKGTKKENLCHQQYYRSQVKFPLYVCEDISTGYCDDDPNPNPCVHSSSMTKLSDDKRTIFTDIYYELGCKQENFNYRGTSKVLDDCGMVFGFPPCQADLYFDACSLRFNQTDAGDETCGGCKDCVCYDGFMYSLSSTVPP